MQDKRGAKKYINVSGNEKISIDELEIECDIIWDGYYGISTNSNLSEQEIFDAYHDLWRIEDSFRAMKSHFEIRPMFHWTPKRIKGHVILNFIALILERHLEKALRTSDTQVISSRKVREAILQMQRSVINVGALGSVQLSVSGS